MIADGDSTYFLRPLEYHFAIFHTLSSLERESHPSLRLNHHCVPTTFWTRSISAPGKHRLNNHASCPSALQSSKGKTPLREQEEFAFVRTIILAEFFFEILVYLTETAGPFFFFFPQMIGYSNLSLKWGQWQTFWVCFQQVIAHVHMQISSHCRLGAFCTPVYFLKIHNLCSTAFHNPLPWRCKFIYFTVSASSKRHILFCLQLSSLLGLRGRRPAVSLASSLFHIKHCQQSFKNNWLDNPYPVKLFSQ